MALNVFGIKEVDDRDLKAMRAETDGFVMLDDSAYALMDFAALESHVALAKRADASEKDMDCAYHHMKDAAIEEKLMCHSDVGFERDGAGARGKGLKVCVEECRLPELVKEFKGEAPYKDYEAERSRLNNAKGRKAITVEEYNTQMTALKDRRAELIRLIQEDVAAKIYESTGRTLEAEVKRRKIDNAKLEKAQKLVQEVYESGKDGGEAVKQAKDLWSAGSSSMFGEEAAKTTAAEKETEKKAAEEIAATEKAKERAKNPEAFDRKVKEAAEKKKAKAAENAAKNVLSAKAKADQAEAKKASQLAGLKTKANHNMKELRRKLEEAQERAKDPVAYDTKKKAENAKKEEKEKETDQAEKNPAPTPDKKAGAEKTEEKEKDEHAIPVHKPLRPGRNLTQADHDRASHAAARS